MTLDPQTQELLVTFGPIALTIVGGVMTMTFGVLMALGRYAWSVHQLRMAKMAEALTKLAEGIQQHEEYASGEHKKIWDAVQGLRAELQLANRNTDMAKTGLSKVEGALENHRSTLYQHIEKLGILDGKLSKLFRFVDAPRRATDGG